MPTEKEMAEALLTELGVETDSIVSVESFAEVEQELAELAAGGLIEAGVHAEAIGMLAEAVAAENPTSEMDVEAAIGQARDNPTDDPVEGKWNFMDYGIGAFHQFDTELKLREYAARKLTGALRAAAESEVESWPITDPTGQSRYYKIRFPKLRPEEIVIQRAAANPTAKKYWKGTKKMVGGWGEGTKEWTGRRMTGTGEWFERRGAELSEKNPRTLAKAKLPRGLKAAEEWQAKEQWEGSGHMWRTGILYQSGYDEDHSAMLADMSWGELDGETKTRVRYFLGEEKTTANPVKMGPGGSCPPGFIRRAGYTRDPFTATREGTRYKVGRTRVPATCVEDVGKPGKTPARERVLPPPEEGALHGWKKELPAGKRRKILLGIARDESYRDAVGRLNLLANYTKRTSPETHKAARSDMAWLKRHRQKLRLNPSHYADNPHELEYLDLE